MLRKLVPLLASLALTLPAHAWGGLGHQYVARLAIADLPESGLKRLLAQNADWFATASSHPDRWRNRPDHAEGARHFLDTERFGVGTDLSRIPHDFAEVQQLRNYMQLRTDGMNPWTVDRRYQLLVRALREKRWEDALVQAAYLSHYIGDAHVPFHASENYDGQLSNPPQRGIHARFEEKVLERSIQLADLKTGDPLFIGDPIAFTFDTLQASIDDVPAILTADRRAQDIAGNADSPAYWTAFVSATRPIAIRRLETGGRALAGLLERAWRAAGRPTPPSVVTVDESWLPYAAPFVPRGTPFPPPMPPVSDEAKAAARSRATTLTITSKALGKSVPTTVLLPKDYGTSGLRYPVLYLLHGASGRHTDWLNNSGLAAYTADLPLIIVLPDAQGDSFYQNSAGFGNWQDYFETELRPQIERQYRTIQKREGRAIAGLSMGGYGAWHLALSHPRTYCAAASLSGVLGWGEGALVPPLRGFAQRVYPTNTDALYAASALWPRIEKLGKGAPALWFDCGKDDFLIESNRAMEKRLLEKRLPFEFSEFDGAHTWQYWDSHLRDILNFCRRHLAKPRR